MIERNMIAFIPARGGSQRLPGKNIKLLYGKPLIEWIIRFALKSSIFLGVYVSTDDNEIATISENAGAQVIIRPPELASDFSSTAESAGHAYEVISNTTNIDFLCTLQPTNRLRPCKLMEDVIEKLVLLDDHTSLTTVSKCELKLGRISAQKEYISVNYSLGQRSQDMDHLFYENGLLYITPAKLIETGKLFGGRVITFETDKRYSIGIDDLIDFQLAELMFKENIDELSYLL